MRRLALGLAVLVVAALPGCGVGDDEGAGQATTQAAPAAGRKAALSIRPVISGLESPVHVTARVEGGEVVVTVDDAGTGVQESESGTIFERFYRSADQEPEPRGLGLGLWIVKSIVERHGGRVGATRTPQGLSRLVVALPLASGKMQA